GRASLGVGRCTHWLGGRSLSSCTTLAGSAAGTPSLYHAGSCGPARRSVVPGGTPCLAVPAAAGLGAAERQSQVPLLPTTRTWSSSSTVALTKKFVGPSGTSLPSERWIKSQRSAAVS